MSVDSDVLDVFSFHGKCGLSVTVQFCKIFIINNDNGKQYIWVSTCNH